MNHDVLHGYVDAGVSLIPSTPDGRCFTKWGDPDGPGYITSHTNLDISIKSGVSRFQFVPARAGYAIIDIDRKNGKDGLKDIERLFNAANVPTPPELQDHALCPCYTETPSGGLHLYFRYGGFIPLRSGPLRYRGVHYLGVEMLYDGHLATAAGSRKMEGEYILHGSLDAATVLPPMLIQLARIEPKERRLTPSKTAPSRSLADVVAIVDRQGIYGPGQSRNRYTYEVAKFARKCGVPASEVVTWADSHLGADDFTVHEIERTVSSAYSKEV